MDWGARTSHSAYHSHLPPRLITRRTRSVGEISSYSVTLQVLDSSELTDRRSPPHATRISRYFANQQDRCPSIRLSVCLSVCPSIRGIPAQMAPATNVRRILVRGPVPPCHLRRRKFRKSDYEMVHSEVYLNKCVVSIAPFSTPAAPALISLITHTTRAVRQLYIASRRLRQKSRVTGYSKKIRARIASVVQKESRQALVLPASDIKLFTNLSDKCSARAPRMDYVIPTLLLPLETSAPWIGLRLGAAVKIPK